MVSIFNIRISVIQYFKLNNILKTLLILYEFLTKNANCMTIPFLKLRMFILPRFFENSYDFLQNFLIIS